MPPIRTTPTTPMTPIAVILWVSRNERDRMGDFLKMSILKNK